MRPIARRNELVVQEMAGETLVYDLRTNKAICLNQTSALVWQNCDGKKNVLEIASEMEKQLNNSVSEDLVWFALNQLKKEQLLQNEELIPDKFHGLNRREVIKRLGVASAVSLPIIASLVAPTAVSAQSCGATPFPAGCPCAAPADCASAMCNPVGMCG
jgi:hypothetical protein